MAIQIKHAFVSAKGDGGDATLVRPSNWNAVHSTSMATGQLIGRLTAGAGAFEEIPISAYMAGLLAAADQATLAGLLGLFETGDIKYTFKTTASSGWIMMQGGLGIGAGAGNTIGNAASGALIRANADCLPLYTLVYNACPDGLAPVSGGRGASAAADFAANKTIAIPYLVGRSPVGAGIATASLALSARVLGTGYGEESHVQTLAEMVAHAHGGQTGDDAPDHSHGYNPSNAFSPNVTGGGGIGLNIGTASNATTGASTRHQHPIAAQGGGAAANVVHPIIALNVMVKL